MKQLFLSLLFLSVAAVTTVSAQHFGLRVGINATNASLDFNEADIDTEGETNLALGLFFNLPVGTPVLSIQPELTYLNRGYSTEVSVGDVVEFERTVAYLDLGALVRLNFGAEDGLGFYVGAGPYYSYAISGQVTDVAGERDVDFDADRLNRGELQLAGVGGVTFGSSFKFFAEVRYMGTLSDQSSDDDLEIRQNALGINGGVMIPLGN